MHKNFILSATATVLLPSMVLLALFLFVYKERGIVYKTDMIFSKCGLAGFRGKDCAGIYHMIIGNTGEQEEAVRLFWPVDLSAWGSANFSVMNITADRPRTHDPVWTCNMSAAESLCAIDKIAPGTLVIMELECYACTRLELGKLEETPVSVQSAAKTFHGDPRLVTIFWRIQNFLNFLL